MPDLADRGRDARDERHLVLPAHHAARLKSPFLIRAGTGAKRLEGNARLHGPSVFEPARVVLPDGIQAAVRHAAVVGDLTVPSAAERVELEVVPGAAVVKR